MKTAVQLSVIIPVYNVQEYLAETIDSVISQSIGFRDNIEIILINDGSPDDSGDICEEYANRYPENIRYVEQANAGVSTARNNGRKYARGTYIHFLDSDDILSKHAYKRTLAFLEAHKEINFATMRLEFFDANFGEHPLNYKFSQGDRVVDIDKEPSALVFHAAATVFRRKELVAQYESNIKISEDVRFLAEQLKVNNKYGVVASATYFYRRRSDGLSAINGSKSNKTFYTITPYNVYEYLFATMPKYGKSINLYAQHAVMYDLQWRIRQKSQAVLDDKEEARYKQTIYNLVTQIDDAVILKQRHFSIVHKMFVLKKKYGSKSNIPKDTLEQLQEKADEDKQVAIIEFIEDHDDVITIEGRLPDCSELHAITATCGDSNVALEYHDVAFRRIEFLGDMVSDGFVFKTQINKKDLESTPTFRVLNNGTPIKLSTRRQSRVPEAPTGYTRLAGMIIRKEKTGLHFYKYNSVRHTWCEFVWLLRMLVTLRLRHCAKMLRALLKSHMKRKIPFKKWYQPFMTPFLDFGRNVRDISFRLMYHVYRPKNPVWIVSDRFLAAGDNGEALFRYIKSLESVPTDVYFAISSESPDYEGLKSEFGDAIIDNTTLRYKALFLRASEIISSHADDFVINPFNWRVKNFYDLFKFNFVFLQHGVTRNDMSGWLNRYNKNIKLFITVSEQERQSIFDFNYYYTPEKVLLSGFPRFDRLNSEPKNKLILAPTWRDTMAAKAKDASGNRAYLEGFKETEYFEFYDTLMNCPRMKKFLAKYNLHGEFYLHPAFQPQIVDFNTNDMFTIKEFPYDYKTAFREGTVMVTDYSSVFFDFIYLDKPVVFSQFDGDYIFDIHLYNPGYIDDKKNGFGPVAKTINQVIDSLEEIAKNNFKLQPVYQKRVDNFFKYHDKNNSKRVYEAVAQLDANNRDCL